MNNKFPQNPRLGFGFDPAQSQHHFVVWIPASARQEVMVHELQVFDEDLKPEALHLNFLGPESSGKILLNRSKWDKIEQYLRIEFNNRLKAVNRNAKTVVWKKGVNHLHRLLGKELMVLAWAVEDAEPGAISQAVENWLGLRPEERWWLYTVTNAATGHPTLGRGKGWRKALRFALTENPIPEGRYTQALLDEEKNTLFEEETDIYSAKE
ncbi:MAG: DUF3780 domain-containing protein [Bacteroidia bacterium]|nr:DUF3780 domain-containing protein [Bacteroidia bacterium]